MRSLGYKVMRWDLPKYVVIHTYITLKPISVATSKPQNQTKLELEKVESIINPPFAPFLRRHTNTVPKVLKVRRTDSVEIDKERVGWLWKDFYHDICRRPMFFYHEICRRPTDHREVIGEFENYYLREFLGIWDDAIRIELYPLRRWGVWGGDLRSWRKNK